MMNMYGRVNILYLVVCQGEKQAERPSETFSQNGNKKVKKFF